MNIHTIADMLAELPTFEGMSREHLAFISGCAKNAPFNEGDFLLYAGKPATHFYLIRKGQVALEMEAANQIVTLQTLGEGSVLGWSWLVPPYTWHYDARAVSHVSAISFDAGCVREHCESNPVFGYQVFKRFASLIVDRLMATSLQLADLYH